jgi:hypothetical protein
MTPGSNRVIMMTVYYVSILCNRCIVILSCEAKDVSMRLLQCCGPDHKDAVASTANVHVEAFGGSGAN